MDLCSFDPVVLLSLGCFVFWSFLSFFVRLSLCPFVLLSYCVLLFCCPFFLSSLTILSSPTYLSCLSSLSSLPFKERCEICGSYLQEHHQHPVSRALFWQSHTARHRKIKRKDWPIGLLVKSLLLQEQYASLHFHAMIGRQGSVVVRQIFIPDLSCPRGTP